MYEIDVCYKLIFEAITEDCALTKIAEKINEYTNAKVIFVSGSGKILAYSNVCETDNNESVRQKHVTIAGLGIFHEKYDSKGRYVITEPVEVSRRLGGYVTILYEEKECQAFFGELAGVIGQAVKGYFEEELKECMINQSFEKAVIAWNLLYGDSQEISEAENRLKPQYMEIFIQKEKLQTEEIVWIEKLPEMYCVYEDEKEILVLLSGLNNKTISEIYKKVKEKKISCSISEPFSDLKWCASKYRLLKRMALVSGIENDPVMKREKEWAIQGLYTYTLPLFEAAGLSDYRVLKLIQEDEENKTDLYYTLKVYLLNGNNVTMAAENLHIHRNTLVYRLKQIKECIEVDFNDNEISRDLLAYMMMYDISRQEK